MWAHQSDDKRGRVNAEEGGGAEKANSLRVSRQHAVPKQHGKVLPWRSD